MLNDTIITMVTDPFSLSDNSLIFYKMRDKGAIYSFRYFDAGVDEKKLISEFIKRKTEWVNVKTFIKVYA